MKSTRPLFLSFLLFSIRQANGEEDYYDYNSGSGEMDYTTTSTPAVGIEKETVKKCDPSYYKCGDVCVWREYSCSCGNVTLSKHSPSYCCTDTRGQVH